jgi:type I restriction enzyme R subunit
MFCSSPDSKAGKNLAALRVPEALETPALWEVPEIQAAGGIAALRKIGAPVDVVQDAKSRLFAA